MSEASWEFYKLWINDIALLREARRQTTTFFVTLNLAGYGALGFLLSPQNAMPRAFLIWPALAMLLANQSWTATDKWYAKLTEKKFLFLHEVEKDLPRQPIQEEFRNGGGKHWLGAILAMERFLPTLFSLGFALIAAISLPWSMPFAMPPWWASLLAKWSLTH